MYTNQRLAELTEEEREELREEKKALLIQRMAGIGCIVLAMVFFHFAKVESELSIAAILAMFFGLASFAKD